MVNNKTVSGDNIAEPNFERDIAVVKERLSALEAGFYQFQFTLTQSTEGTRHNITSITNMNIWVARIIFGLMILATAGIVALVIDRYLGPGYIPGNRPELVVPQPTPKNQ